MVATVYALHIPPSTKRASPGDITDAELAEAIRAKNAEDPRFYRRVWALVSEFKCASALSFHGIPQSSRREFLDRLGKIGSRLRKTAG
jgi:hypothetical protein